MCIALVRIEKSRVVLTFVRKINAVALVSRNRKNEKRFFTIHILFPCIALLLNFLIILLETLYRPVPTGTYTLISLSLGYVSSAVRTFTMDTYYFRIIL